MIEDILNERSKTHGDFAAQAAIAQKIKALVAIDCPVLQEAAHMICHKLARIVAGNEREPDHWVDIAGYATLAVRHLEAGTRAADHGAIHPEAGKMHPIPRGGLIEQLIVRGEV